jgi:hypothetical protein
MKYYLIKEDGSTSIIERNTDRDYLIMKAREYARINPGIRYRIAEATFETMSPVGGLYETTPT